MGASEYGIRKSSPPNNAYKTPSLHGSSIEAQKSVSAFISYTMVSRWESNLAQVSVAHRNDPITSASRMLWRTVKRNSLPSSDGFMPVAATATAILDKEIIFPITPPAEFTAAVSTDDTRAFAVTTCRFPNSAFAEYHFRLRRLPSNPISH